MINTITTGNDPMKPMTYNSMPAPRDMLNEFVSFIDIKPASASTYRKAIKQFFEYVEMHGITAPTRETVIDWREDMKESHSASTVQTYMIAVRRFFQWASNAGYYSNIADGVKGVKVSRSHKRDYLTQQQAKHLLSNIDQTTSTGKRDFAIVALMISCGLRDIEVARANICDLKAKGGRTVLYIQGKGRDDRDEFITVPAPTEEAIRRYLSTRSEAKGNEPLFISESRRCKGARLSTRTISGIVKEELRGAGFNSDRLTAHSLRHTAATLALLNGCDIRQVQQFLRHASINTTEIYSHDLDAIENPCSTTIASLF